MDKNLPRNAIIIGLAAVAFLTFRSFITASADPYASEIAAAFLGALLTAILTMMLLREQTKSEGQKEKDVVYYERKLDAYNDLMDALEEAMCEGKPKNAAANNLRFQSYRTRLVAHETVVKRLNEFSVNYKELVRDDEFSGDDWDLSRDAMNALVDAMRADLEADRRGSPLPPLQRDAPMLSSLGSSALGQSAPVVEMPVQADESLDSGDFTRETNKEEFLAQCTEIEKPYFLEVLAYCESRPNQIIVDWGTKGFSIKDKNKRQILWMFPQVGANSKSNINARTQKWNDTEIAQVRVILDATKKIPKWSWRPADLPFEQLKKIINLVCGI